MWIWWTLQIFVFLCIFFSWTRKSYSETSLIRHSMGYQKVHDYGVSISIPLYGDCTSQDGLVRQNVGL